MAGHSTRAAAAAHPLEFEISRCRTTNFATCFLPSQVQMWNDLQLCLTPERWMGSRVPSTVLCYPEFRFLQFSVLQVLVGLRNQFINKFVLPTLACAASFNNNKDTDMCHSFKGFIKLSICILISGLLSKIDNSS